MSPDPIGKAYLRCPVTMAPLKPLEPEKLKCLNRMIAAGRARHVDGTTVARVVRTALITADDRLIYRFDNHHAIMLAAKGIRADQLPEIACRKTRRPPGVIQ